MRLPIHILFYLILSTNIISAQTGIISAATLDIEVQGITKGGILNLEISSSKEAFESDGDDAGVAVRIQERVTIGSYQRSFEIPPATDLFFINKPNLLHEIRVCYTNILPIHKTYI
tara:strand:+ start:370 stop:717 length:348 start_codon:yes stop_codon:yes gene_type:complete